MKNLLLISIILLVFSSCNEKYTAGPNGAGRKADCPAYNSDHLKDFVTYNIHETFMYKDSAGTTYTLSIDSIYKSKDYISDNIETCSSNGAVYALANSADSLDIGMIARHFTGYHVYNGNFTIKFMGTTVQLSGFPGEELKGSFGNGIKAHNDTTINGTRYERLFEVLIKEDAANKLTRLYLVKGKGIIGFKTSDSITYWRE